MDFVNFFLTYNWIFRYYLSFLLIFNVSMFYNFVFLIPKSKNKNYEISSNDNSEIITKYDLMFKKLVKISKNPIIFEYQLEQINKFLPNPNNYIKYQKYIQDINDLDNKNNSVYKNYKKIKQTLIKNKLLNVDEIIIKLLCVNFS